MGYWESKTRLDILHILQKIEKKALKELIKSINEESDAHKIFQMRFLLSCGVCALNRRKKEITNLQKSIHNMNTPLKRFIRRAIKKIWR